MSVPPHLPPLPHPYQVLGDLSEYEQYVSANTPPPPPPEPDTIDNIDPNEFPEDVLAAALISPDRGAAIIRAYREVRAAR